MTNASVNLQQILKQHWENYRQQHSLDQQRLKVCQHLLSCHTPALGGLQLQCDHCQQKMPQYHSCRDRHCPQCQQRASKRWSEQQQKTLLPVTYYHLVFTLPHELNGWVQLHPDSLYALLFKSVWKTLNAFAADPKRLNGKLGMTAVLHTWGQNLSQHVHLHCLIPGGALGNDQQWHAARSSYLFPVRALSRHFRGNMVSALRQSAQAGQLHRITQPGEVDQILDKLMNKPWVIYSKPSLNHTQSIIGYLARYSHRIAISDQRIIAMTHDQVSFSYKNYRNGKNAVMQLHYEEFIRRYLMHILPKGLMRIRHFGFLANRCKTAALSKIRQLLAQPEPETETEEGKEQPITSLCPKCRQGHLVPIRLLYPVKRYGWIPTG